MLSFTSHLDHYFRCTHENKNVDIIFYCNNWVNCDKKIIRSKEIDTNSFNVQTFCILCNVIV